MTAGVGFYSGWQPHNLGSALVYAVDTNDAVNCAPNDGSGQVSQLRHLYDTTKYILQPTFANRPVLATGNGADGKRRVLTFGPGRYLANSGNHPALLTMMNGLMTTTSGTMMMAVKLAANDAQWAEPWLWINTAADKWVHLHQRGTANLWFRTRDSSVNYNADYAASLTGWFYISAIKSGTALTLRVNGSQVATGTYSGAANTFTAANFMMNATQDSAGTVISDGSGDTYTQAVSGIIAASTALTGSALLGAETWLRQTAGL